MATWEGRGNAHLQVETKLSAILQLCIFVSKLMNVEFKIDENVLKKKFWGNNFYNATTKKFTTTGVA